MKRHFYFQKTIGLLCVLLISLGSNAQLASWQFNTPASLGTEATYASTSLATGVEASQITRGAGFIGASLGRGLSATVAGWVSTGTTKTMALANNDYFQTTVKGKAGYKISLKSIDATFRRSANGNKNYRWSYSLDGTNFTEIGSADILDFDATANTNGVAQPQVDLTGVAALQNVAASVTVTFRLYAWGSNTSGGTFAIGRPSAAPSLIVSGNAEALIAPLVGWQFVAPATLGNEATVDATTVDTNLNTPVLSRGAAFSPFTLGRGLSSIGLSTIATKNDAISLGGYYQFSILAKPSISVSLSSIAARLRRSANGATAYRWAYSIDGTNFTEVGTDIDFTSIEDGVTQPDVDLGNVSELQNVAAGTNLTFRLYAWGFVSTSGGSFSIGRYLAGESNNSLIVNGTALSVILPLKLLSFSAINLESNKVEIKWRTNAESNMLKYELQRSINGTDFSTIYTAKAGNNAQANNYTFTDKPAATVSYYRLKMIEKDGSFKLSNIIKTGAKVNATSLKVYPNPVVDDNTTVYFDETNTDGVIRVFNTEGKSVAQQKVSKLSTQSTINTSNYIAGVYYVQFINGTVTSKTSFIKK